jgi:hypothetical protein
MNTSFKDLKPGMVFIDIRHSNIFIAKETKQAVTKTKTIKIVTFLIIDTKHKTKMISDWSIYDWNEMVSVPRAFRIREFNTGDDFHWVIKSIW